MKIEVTKHQASIVHQGKRSQFYFQVDNPFRTKYILHYLFRLKVEGGIYMGNHLKFGPKNWIESKTTGVFFDTNWSILRIGIYLHPVVYDVEVSKV